MSEAKEKNDKRPGEEEDRPTASYDGSAIVPGSQIGQFRIERELGRGAVGVVYLAHDTKLDRPVAIKSLPAEVMGDPKTRSRFTREARVLASLNHPNIATIHDELEEAEGVVHLILEYVPGQTLAERIAKKPLKLEEALTIALQIAEAVAAAHEHDVIHRDLKPGNIKITPEGKVKVLDFGLAKAVGGEAVDQQSTVTEPGRVIGTPAYMSPEQARGKATDKRSDIWSFGCVLYEMLTSRVPFEGETVSDTLAGILEHEPNWQALPQGTPANIVALLRRCLEKEPRRRLRDIGDIAIPLEDTTVELQRSTLPTETVKAEPVQVAKWSRRALPWFITGVAVTLMVLFSAELGKIKALRVISRTSAMQYKDTDKVIPEIAKELDVDAVVEGSVLKAGNDVRVTAQLVDGRTDAHLWSDNYTGTLTNILALQSQVTLAIAREIEATLTPEEEAHITRTEVVNPKAYEAYLLGIHYLNKGLESDIEIAIEYFKRALEIDSNYAIAYVGLADAYKILGNTNIRSPEDTWQNARTAAEKALAIDEGLAEAHTALAVVKYLSKWDWQGAEREFKRALEINPNSADAHLEYSNFLLNMERYDEALSQNERASELDPHSIWVKFFKWLTLYMSGRETEAIQLVENAIESDPDQAHPYWYWWLTNSYAGQGRYEEALAPLRTQINLMEEDVTDELGLLGYLYGRLGQKAKALEQLEALDELAAKGRYVSPVTRSLIYIGLDDKDKAFTCLEEGYRRHSAKMVWLKVWFFFNTLRDDPRFQDLLRRMNFPEAPDSGVVSEPIEAAQAPIEKIAVLPFTSISSEAGEDWLVDGVTEMLSIRLGQIKALTVISSRSAMQFKGVSKPMREIARELGVEGLIEGTVIRVRDDVQITAGLIDGRIDKRIWGDVFQGTFSNILALQSEVTLAIAREIEVALTPEEELRIADTKPINPEAYEAFLKGRLFFDKFTAESLKTAVVYLQQAIDMKPDYAEAHALLAGAYWVPSIWGYSRPHESFAKAKRAASTAMALDDTDAQTHVAVGWIALAYDWQWQKAKESFERAIKFNPSYADGHQGLASYLVVAGRFDEAIETMRTAVKLDPLSRSYNNALANVYSHAGQVERAIEQRKKTLELYPDYLDARDNLADDYLSMSMYPEAVATIERGMSLAGRTPELVTRLARAYALSGRRDEADALLQELHERAASEYVLPRYFAEVYASLGNTDEALKWLEKGYEERDWGMLLLKTWSAWDSLRSDPRFDDLVKRMQFPE